MWIFYIQHSDLGASSSFPNNPWSLDLISSDGAVFAVESDGLATNEYIKSGYYVYGVLGVGSNQFELDNGWYPELNEDNIVHISEEEYRLKWLMKTKVYQWDIIYQEYYRWWFFWYKWEKIKVYAQVMKPVPDIPDRYYEDSLIPNEWHGKHIIVNMACPYWERYDQMDPIFEAYFGFKIFAVATSPELLIQFQAAQEWKIITLEEAKEITKDWHFGGVR